MCLQGEADANKVSEQVTLGYTQATTATTGGQLLAKCCLRQLPTKASTEFHPNTHWRLAHGANRARSRRDKNLGTSISAISNELLDRVRDELQQTLLVAPAGAPPNA